jgi:hypothetical protein
MRASQIRLNLDPASEFDICILQMSRGATRASSGELSVPLYLNNIDHMLTIAYSGGL